MFVCAPRLVFTVYLATKQSPLPDRGPLEDGILPEQGAAFSAEDHHHEIFEGRAAVVHFSATIMQMSWASTIVAGAGAFYVFLHW